MNKRLIFIVVFLWSLAYCAFGQVNHRGPFDPSALRADLSNASPTATLTTKSIVLSEKVRAAWAEITGDIYASGTLVIDGVGKFSDGTAAAPSITFGSDPDTGLYRYGVNSIGVALQGGLKLRFAGDVLFFQNNYQIAMDTSDGADNKYFGLAGGGTTSNSRGASLFVLGNEVPTEGGQLQINAGDVSTGHIIAKTQGSERWRTTYGGNLLIGTTTDDGVNKLQVNGSMVANVNTLVSGIVPIYDSGLTTGEVLTTTIKLGDFLSSGRIYFLSTSHAVRGIIEVIGGTLTMVTGTTTSEVSVTKDTASKMNFYIESGVLKIQNNRASATTLYASYVGIHDN